MIILGFRGVNWFGLHEFSCFFYIYIKVQVKSNTLFLSSGFREILTMFPVSPYFSGQVFNGFPVHQLFIDVSRKHMKLKMRCFIVLRQQMTYKHDA